jgi:hypothetical protein
MDDALCICFYTMLCGSLCCPPLKPALTSEPGEVVVKNPSSSSGSEKDAESLKEPVIS